MIKLNSSKAAASDLMEAMRGEDEAAISQAFEKFAESVAADVAGEFRSAVAQHDEQVLAQRGFRMLTSEETEYYQHVIDALRSDVPQQAFATIPEKMMPVTIFDQVLKDIEQAHPLLAKLNIVNTQYLTRWLRNKHTAQAAAWGEIDSTITQEITSAFEVIEITQGKLSAYAVLTRDMLELGPRFLDGYVRTVLGEAIAYGFEYGAVKGIGIKGEPIGMIKDIHTGVNVNQTTGYPDKTATAVTAITPTTWGALVASLAKDENQREKNVNMLANGNLCLIVNNTDYLTKVVPAVRVMGTDGIYRDSFPIPTEVVVSNQVPSGKAILALMDEYQMFVGGNRGIEYSDEFAFLEDKRYFKIVSYAYGRAEDNTSAAYLDISGLQPAVVPVSVQGTVTTHAAQ